MDSSVKKMFDSKKRFHRRMRKLPYERKIEIVLKLQEFVRNVKQIRRKVKI